MKLLVHVGLHRAASTALQAWLEARRPEFGAAGCFLYSDLSSGRQGSLFSALAGGMLETAGPQSVAASIGDELDRLAAEGFTGGLLSDENLLGPMPAQGVAAFSALERLARAFEALKGRHEIVPVIILREHLGWLTSLYRIAQLRGDIRRFAVFAAQTLPPGTGFAPLLGRLTAAVAPATPIVTTLEAVAADEGREFLGRLGDELGLRLEASSRVLAPVNRAPLPLISALRHEAARMGGFLVLDGAPGLMRQVALLSHRRDARNREGYQATAALIRERTVRVPARLPYRLKTRRAAIGLASGGAFLTLQQAHAILAASLRAIALPPCDAAAETVIRARFGADRALLAARYAIEWGGNREAETAP